MLSPPPVPISQNGALQAVLQLLYQKLGAKRTSPNPAGPAPPATIRAAAAMHPGPVDESVSRLSPPAPQRARSPWLHRHTFDTPRQSALIANTTMLANIPQRNCDPFEPKTTFRDPGIWPPWCLTIITCRIVTSRLEDLSREIFEFGNHVLFIGTR